MPNKDKNNKNNPKPSKFNKKAFKHAIGMIESSGGKFLETGINPNTGKRWSSAAGKYHFLYSAIKNDPSMDGVSKREFMNRPELQESIMDKALDGSLKDYTYGEKYARKLKGEFGSDMDVNDLTAMVHFIGAGNVRKYLKDPDNFKVPGGQNMTVDGYVKKFRGYFDKNMLDQGFVKEPKTLLDPSPKREVPSNIPNERNIPRAQDNTNANSMNDLMSKLSQNESSFTNKQESNSFKGGGQMSAQSGADALVTVFEGGGSHEDNPLGGIPQGVGANGKTNLVEEGETKWNDYIFSNSFDMGGNFTGEDGNKSNVFAEGGDLELVVEPVIDPLKEKENEEETIESTIKAPMESLGSKSRGLIRSYKRDINSDNSKRFKRIDKAGEGSCLAGALNCGTGSADNKDFGFINQFLPTKPSLRSYLNKGDVDKYRTKDVYTDDIQGFVENTSIDAWEIHDYLRGEKLGYNPYKGVEFTYENHDIIPDQVLANPSMIPVGTIIGQGAVNNKRGYSGYDEENKTTGKNRHALVVSGYDEKDGMPLVYDSGQERRLDDVVWTRNMNGDFKKVNNFTTPNEYRNVTYDNINNSYDSRSTDLGYSKDVEKNKVNLGSKSKHILAIEKGSNKHSRGISDYYDVEKTAIDKMIKLLPGVSFTETRLNNNEGTSKTILSDSFIGNTLGGKNVGKGFTNAGRYISNLLKEDEKGTHPWEHSIDFYLDNKKGTKEEEDNYINSKSDESNVKENYEEYDNSVGAFKIKDLSEYANYKKIKKSDLYGMDVSNEKELETGSVAALSLIAEKYKQARSNVKEMGLELNEDQLLKLAIVGYKNNSKFISKKYIENYILDVNNLKLVDDSYEAVKSYKVK